MSRLLVEFVASGKFLGIDYISTMSTANGGETAVKIHLESEQTAK